MFELPHEKWCEEEWCTVKKHAEYGQVLITKDKNIVNIWCKTKKGLKCKSFVCYNEDTADQRYKSYITDKYELTKLVKQIVEYHGS